MFVAVVAMVAFCSCSKEEDDLGVDNEIEITINVGERHQIITTDTNVEKFFSSDNFVAPAYKGGYTQGFHVGQAIITIKKGKWTTICKVNVVPNFKIYDSPILKFGVSKEYIKEHEKRTLKNVSTDNEFEYMVYTDRGSWGGDIPIIYAFKKDELVSAMVQLGKYYNRNNILDGFLSERYHKYGYVDDHLLYVHMSGGIEKDNVDYTVHVKSVYGGYQILYLGRNAY